jgi:hypothetical protein
VIRIDDERFEAVAGRRDREGVAQMEDRLLAEPEPARRPGLLRLAAGRVVPDPPLILRSVAAVIDDEQTRAGQKRVRGTRYAVPQIDHQARSPSVVRVLD